MANESADLAILSDARKAVAKVYTVFDAQRLIKLSEAVLAVTDSEEMREKAMELYLRSRRRRGEIVEKLPKQHGSRGIGKRVDGNNDHPLTLKQQGIDAHEVKKDYKLLAIPESRWESLCAKKDKNFTAALRVAKDVIRQKKQKENTDSKAKTSGYVKPDYRIGDFREVLADIVDNSVDLILTDPPYGEKAIVLYQALGELAQRILKPGGSLLAYSGQSTLGEVLQVLSSSLRYWWILCMKHSGTGQKLPGKWVFVDWKPIVWFVKEKRRDQTYIKDFLEGEVPDKTQLEWAQGAGEVRYLIEQLTNAGDLILDPFAGTGRWGEIAGEMGRRWIGSDLLRGGGLNT